MPRGKFFTLESVAHLSCLLEVNDIKGSEDVEVITTRPKGTEASPQIHQLWWIDQGTYSIRAKANNFCLDVKDKKMVIAPFHSLKSDQRWGLGPGGNTIQSRSGDRFLALVEGDMHPGGRVCPVEDKDALGTHWKVKHIPPQLMSVRNAATNKVLDIKGESTAEGTQVILYGEWIQTAENQLWYEDDTGILRSRIKDFALTAEGNAVTVKQYNPSQKNQQWIINNHAIQNRYDPDLVLDFRDERVGIFGHQSVVYQAAYNGGSQQCWELDYLPNQEAMYGAHLGKYSIIRHVVSGLYLTAVPLESVGIPSTRVDVLLQDRSVQTPDYQLWLIDDQAKIIRSAVNDHCLDLIGDQTVVQRHSQDPNQQWRFVAMEIRNISRPSLSLRAENAVLDHSSGFNHVVGCDSEGEPDLWRAERVPARYFFIRSAHCPHVLDIKGGARHSGADVIIYDKKDTGSINQLWFEDENGIIRSKMNGYALDCMEKTVKMRPYRPSDPNQQWIIFGNTIKNQAKPELALDIYGQREKSGTAVIAYTFHGKSNQCWHFDYIDSQDEPVDAP